MVVLMVVVGDFTTSPCSLLTAKPAADMTFLSVFFLSLFLLFFSPFFWLGGLMIESILH